MARPRGALGSLLNRPCLACSLLIVSGYLLPAVPPPERQHPSPAEAMDHRSAGKPSRGTSKRTRPERKPRSGDRSPLASSVQYQSRILSRSRRLTRRPSPHSSKPYPASGKTAQTRLRRRLGTAAANRPESQSRPRSIRNVVVLCPPRVWGNPVFLLAAARLEMGAQWGRLPLGVTRVWPVVEGSERSALGAALIADHHQP